jgi:signal transduction histidine kinase
MGLEELFFIPGDQNFVLHWGKVISAIRAAFSSSHIPTAIAFTLSGIVVGYLYGQNIQSYHHRIIELRRFSIIGQEAATILHDISNPLACISGFADLLSTESTHDELQDYSERIKKSASRIASLLGEIRVIASERTVPHLQKRETALPEMIKQIISTMHLKSSIEIGYSKNVQALIDPSFFERVIWNLLRNAEEALQGFENPRISIQISETDTISIIKITDNGPGIPAKIRDSLFKFGATYGKDSGTGIGLYVCDRIVRAHGGTISATVSDAKGSRKETVFTIELPKK